MKTLVFLTFLTLPLTSIRSQGIAKLAPKVIASSGAHLQATDLKVDYTMGEFMVHTIGQNPQLTQGFQQGNLHVTPSFVHPAFEDKISIFPNPASTVVYVQTETTERMKMSLFSLDGKMMFSDFISGAAEIPMYHLPNGIYILSLVHNGVIIYSAKIEKLN